MKGRIQEADLIEALLPGHKKNQEFMEALGLAVILDSLWHRLYDTGG